MEEILSILGEKFQEKILEIIQNSGEIYENGLGDFIQDMAENDINTLALESLGIDNENDQELILQAVSMYERINHRISPENNDISPELYI